MKTIMTVDDSSTIRQMVNFTLTAAGFQVIEASDGENALTKLRDAQISLFIIDINMPNMNGFELVKHLRAMPQYKFVPAVLLTTESDPDKKQEGKAAGATGWIVKPFRPEQLLTTVAKVIR